MCYFCYKFKQIFKLYKIQTLINTHRYGILISICHCYSHFSFLGWKEKNKKEQESQMYGPQANVYIPEGYELKKKKNSNGCLFYLVLGLFTLIAIIWITGKTSNYNVPKTYGNDDADRIEAYNHAKNFVKDKLKSPSSARFPGTMEKDGHIEYIGDQTYKINSWVEGPNSFGVFIRKHFSCTIYFKEGSVYCEDLIFLD